MAIAHVTNMGQGVTTAGGTSHAFAPTASQVTVGNTLTLILTGQGGSISSVTDSKSNTWTVQQDFLNSGLDIAIATCTPPDAGHKLLTTDTITSHSPTTGYATLWFMDEWSGLTEVTDVTNVTATNVSASITTASQPDLVICASAVFRSAAVTFTGAGGSWVASSVQDVGSPGSYHLMWEYLIATSTGAQSTSGASIGGGFQTSTAMIALKGSGAAVGGHKLSLLGVGT